MSTYDPLSSFSLLSCPFQRFLSLWKCNLPQLKSACKRDFGAEAILQTRQATVCRFNDIRAETDARFLRIDSRMDTFQLTHIQKCRDQEKEMDRMRSEIARLHQEVILLKRERLLKTKK